MFRDRCRCPASTTRAPGFKNYGGIIDTTRGGVLLKTPFNVAYDEDQWYGQRETTGEARFQTSFDGPLNFSAGNSFTMAYDAHNQYWVAASGLDWESVVLGAFSTPAAGPGSTSPLLLAMPTFDAEYQRNAVQSRSGFLEATYDVIPDLLKVIAGARYNDDRTSLIRTPVAVGGGLLTTGLFPIGSTAVQLPVDSRVPTVVTGQSVSTTDLWTGRFVVQYTPKLDFTDQTQVYLTASRGELAGGINVANNGASTIVPTIYKPATVDAIEFGTKNTMLDGTLQANLDAWYYNYENYQVGIIANRQALTLNIPAHLFGLESEFVWQPTEALAFNFTLSLTQSEAGNAFVVDQRNPTANVPGSILVKDLTNGSNCVVAPIAGGPRTAGQTPGDSVAPDFAGGYHVSNFYLPNGGNAAIDAPFGIPFVNYGLCSGNGSAAEAELKSVGFDYVADVNPATGLPTGTHNGNGNAVNLHGNELPQVPFGQVGFGAQYTWKSWRRLQVCTARRLLLAVAHGVPSLERRECRPRRFMGRHEHQCPDQRTGQQVVRRVVCEERLRQAQSDGRLPDGSDLGSVHQRVHRGSAGHRHLARHVLVGPPRKTENQGAGKPAPFFFAPDMGAIRAGPPGRGDAPAGAVGPR